MMYNMYLIKDFISNGFNVNILDIVYLFSLVFGVFTIISKNPVVSVLFLIGLFTNISGLLILVGLNFIGLSYILVYVGAVSILFLFILMLINIRISELISETNNDIPLAILTVLLFYSFVGQNLPTYLEDSYNKNSLPGFLPQLDSISNSIFKSKNIQFGNEYLNIVDFEQQIAYASSKTWDGSLVDVTHITSIGNIMYTSYSIWLLIASVILLLAMIGAIVITIKQR